VLRDAFVGRLHFRYCTYIVVDVTNIADGIQYLGRYKTIMYSISLAVIGHVILTAGAAPSVLKHPDGAFAAFIVAIIIFGMGTGGFKPNISPLIAEQIVGEKLRVATRKDGKKVIIDPAQTSARIYNWFYCELPSRPVLLYPEPLT
jgi:dipeptide/tripeptide permease